MFYVLRVVLRFTFYVLCFMFYVLWCYVVRDTFNVLCGK